MLLLDPDLLGDANHGLCALLHYLDFSMGLTGGSKRLILAPPWVDQRPVAQGVGNDADISCSRTAYF